MNKKLTIVFLVFLFCRYVLQAQELSNTIGIESLWSSAINIDSNVIEIRNDMNSSIIRKKYFTSYWKPLVVIGQTMSYPDNLEKYNNLPNINNTTIAITKPFSSGTKISFDSNYSMSRDYLDNSDLGLAQELNMSIGINQSLNPWWLHTNSHNPYKIKTELNNKINEAKYIISVRSLLLSITEKYITLRQLERKINQMKIQLEYFNQKINVLKELQLQGGINNREIISVQNSRWEIEQELIEDEIQSTALQSDLGLFSNCQFDDAWSVILPNNPYEILLTMIPNIHITDEIVFRFQLEMTNLNKTIRYQENAPSMNFEYSRTIQLPAVNSKRLLTVWTSDNISKVGYKYWGLSLSFDISTLFSKENSRDNLLDDIALETIENKIVNSIMETQRNKQENRKLVEKIQFRIVYFKSLLTEYDTIVKENELMLKQGIISELEYEESIIDLYNTRMIYNNLLDELWFRLLIDQLI